MLNKIISDPWMVAYIILTIILVMLMFIKGIMFFLKKENINELKNEFNNKYKSLYVGFKMFIKDFSAQFKKGYFYVLRLPSIFNFLNICIAYAWILLGAVLIVNEIMETKEFIQLVKTNPDFINMIASNLNALAAIFLTLYLFRLGFIIAFQLSNGASRKNNFKTILRALFLYYVNYIICFMILKKHSISVNEDKVFSTFIASLILWVSFNILSSFTDRIVYKHISSAKICGDKVVVQLDDCLQGLLRHTKSEIIYNEDPETNLEAIRVTFRVSYSFKTITLTTLQLMTVGKAVLVDWKDRNIRGK